MDAETHGMRGNKTDHSISGELYGGSFSGSGTSQRGTERSVSGGSQFVSGEVNKSFKGVGNVKFDKDGKIDEANVLDASVQAKGSLATGHVEGSYGMASANAEGSVVAGEAKISGKIKVFEKGKLAPQASVEAKASIDAVKGSIGATLGSKKNNAHVKANGVVGHAEAKAGAGIGKITYEDENGQTKAEYGAYAEVGAEAYLAKGTLSGGLTICGIKVDASVDFKAGGAGATGSAEVKSGGLKAGLGIGALVGLGVNVSIDWTEFEWPWSDKKKQSESKKSSSSGGNGKTNLDVYPQKLKSDAQTLQDISKEIERLSSQVDRIKGNLEMDGASAVLLKKQMSNVVDNMKEQKKNLKNMSQTLEDISKLYTDTENTIAANA